MGRAASQSWALQFPHILFIEQQLNNMYLGADTNDGRHEIAAAGAAHLLLWMGMLRGGECFNLERSSVAVVPPALGPTRGLPAGIGFVELRLLPETKSSPHRVADIVIAYRSSSGLNAGKWVERLLAFPTQSEYLFFTPKHGKWTSREFRHGYVWPLLELQRAQGEASLMAFNDEPGQRIRDKVWSCHSYRRGFNSYVSQKREGNLRKATPQEINEHARWKEASAPTMHDHYNTDLDLGSRLAITLICA
jgi:hypothetical protein